MRTPFDYPFASSAVVYGLALFVVAFYPRWPDDPPNRDYLAARELVSNHRIVSSDLRRPAARASSWGFYMPSLASMQGKYVVASQPIKAGEAVRRASLAERPDMRLPAGTAAVALTAIDTRVINLIDAGSPVVVFSTEANAPFSTPAVVHAVVCELVKNEGERCYPVVRFPASQVNDVVKRVATLKVAPMTKP